LVKLSGWNHAAVLQMVLLPLVPAAAMVLFDSSKTSSKAVGRA
jgi:hypothetical protein